MIRVFSVFPTILRWKSGREDKTSEMTVPQRFLVNHCHLQKGYATIFQNKSGRRKTVVLQGISLNPTTSTTFKIVMHEKKNSI